MGWQRFSTSAIGKSQRHLDREESLKALLTRGLQAKASTPECYPASSGQPPGKGSHSTFNFSHFTDDILPVGLSNFTLHLIYLSNLSIDNPTEKPSRERQLAITQLGYLSIINLFFPVIPKSYFCSQCMESHRVWEQCQAFLGFKEHNCLSETGCWRGG